jgi:hypothetical protein
MILLFDILSDYVVSLVGWYRVMRLGWGITRVMKKGMPNEPCFIDW